MGVGTLVSRIFSTDEANAAAVVEASFIRALANADADARRDAQRLLDWYQRDDAEILEHIKKRAARTFDSTTDWQFPISNGVPRTIRRVSMNYSPAPLREYYDPKTGKALKPTDERLDKIKAMYAKLDRDRKMRSANRFATLLNTTHLEVIYNAKKRSIDWIPRLRPIVTVVEDPLDFLEFEKIALEWNLKDPETLKPLKGWIYWTPEEHVFLSASGKRVGISNEAGTNPYKDANGEPVIPITTVRINEDIDDYWGALGSDLVDAFEAANVQLGNLWETTQIGNSGWPLLINVEVPDGSTLKYGLKHPLVSKKVMKDDMPPSVTFPKPEPDYLETQALLDWFIKSQEGNHGLNPRASSVDGATPAPESGFSKFMSNIELLENRDETSTQWEGYEIDLDAKSRLVWNASTPEALHVPPIEEVALRVKFTEAKVPESPTERATRWALEIKSGLKSPVDFYIETEGLDEEAAIERAQHVADLNKKFGGAQPGDLPDDDFTRRPGPRPGEGGLEE